MAAYFIVEGEITNDTQYQKYREAVVPLITRFGGKMIVRGGKMEVLEGKHDGRRRVIFEFPSMDAVRSFWTSPEYAQIKPLRRNAADFDIWAIDGV
jgi:uncharacterized protein (DUF1330 family)